MVGGSDRTFVKEGMHALILSHCLRTNLLDCGGLDCARDGLQRIHIDEWIR